MKLKIASFAFAIIALQLSSCATGPHATTDTAVGAVGGAVIAGPVGAVAGGTAGNAIGHDQDRRDR